MQIDDTLIAYLEDLSCLALNKSEKKRIKADLEKILANVSRLSEIDTDGIEERSHPFDEVNAFREDEVQESLARGLALKNAPAATDEMFIAPKVL